MRAKDLCVLEGLTWHHALTAVIAMLATFVKFQATTRTYRFARLFEPRTRDALIPNNVNTTCIAGTQTLKVLQF